MASAAAAAALLVAIAMQPVGTSLAVLVALAAGIGLATPPVGACLRTQLPVLVPDRSTLRAAYALEASVVELTFIFGPPLALCVGALWSTGAALAAGGIVLLLATAAFAAQPASRSWRPAPGRRRPARRLAAHTGDADPGHRPGRRRRAAGCRRGGRRRRGQDARQHRGAAPLLALWGIGSFAGGLVAARLGGGARGAAGLALVLGGLTAGHLGLIPADTSVLALGCVLVLAGATIAPTEAAIYAMVDSAAPAGSVTEAFAWLATAMAVGGALGAAGAGPLIERLGPTAGFALAGGAGVLAVLATLARSRTITGLTTPSPTVAPSPTPIPEETHHERPLPQPRKLAGEYAVAP